MEKNERQSNIEILRIIAMLMIIISHYAIYSTEKYYLLPQEIIKGGGKIGAIIFILITGYFSINKSFSFKKVLKIWGETFFYSVGLLLFSNIIEKSFKFEYNDLLFFIPVIGNIYWFMTIYVIIYVLSPFINKLIKSMSKEKIKMLLIILFLMFIVPTQLFNNEWKYIVGTSEIGLFIYIIGCYIKLYGIQPLEKMNKKSILIVAIFAYATMIAIEMLSKSTYIKSEIETFDSPLIIICAILMFYIFNKMNIRSNKIINYIASLSFPVYLFHEHPKIRKLLWKEQLFTNQMPIKNYWVILIYSICIIYLITIIIEIVRRNAIEKQLMENKKINDTMFKINNYINTI